MDTINETVPAARKSADASAGKKKPRRRERDRIEYSRYRDDALEFAYRFGGFTARQLSELLELRYPELVGDGESKTSPSLRASYRAIESLKRSKLVKKVAVRRDHLAEADARVTPEDFVYLSPAYGSRAVVWAASLCGVEQADEARDGYKRHQLPRRPEHASWRTDLILLLLRAAGDAGVEAPVAEAFGESYPGYPYWIKKPLVDKAGEPLPERKNGRSYYDPAIPDASVEIYGTRYDLEVERWIRTGYVETGRKKGKKGVVPKIERHAAYWLRLYKLAEGLLVRTWIKQRAAELKAAKSERKVTKPEVAAYRDSLGWLGLPEDVAPLVIVMRTEADADRMRARVRAAYDEGRMPRLAELQRKLGPHGFDAGRLVLYAGWDTLSRSSAPLDREYLPHSWREIDEGEEAPQDVDAVSLWDVAQEMASLSAGGGEA